MGIQPRVTPWGGIEKLFCALKEQKEWGELPMSCLLLLFQSANYLAH